MMDMEHNGSNYKHSNLKKEIVKYKGVTSPKYFRNPVIELPEVSRLPGLYSWLQHMNKFLPLNPFSLMWTVTCVCN
jgi:hypothetical protein